PQLVEVRQLGQLVVDGSAESPSISGEIEPVGLKQRLDCVAATLFGPVEQEAVRRRPERLGWLVAIVGENRADPRRADGVLARIVDRRRVGASAAADADHAVLLAAIAG